MESAVANNPWRSSAAYLYILELDRAALAWEYLRRNERYKRQWNETKGLGFAAQAQIWHCTHLVDPALDARTASPEWLPPSVHPIRIVPCDAASDAPRFSPWRIPGQKTLYRTAAGFVLAARVGPDSWRLSLSSKLHDESSFAYQIPAGLNPSLAISLIGQINEAMAPGSVSKTRASDSGWRPKREAILHMRTLQVLDGVAASATHRSIAECIYGADEVWRRWYKYGEFPSHIRYLLRRGRALVEGGYCRLLTPR